MKVQRVEGLVNIEVRGGIQASADSLSSALDLKVDSPHVAELDGGVSHEAVVTAVERVPVVGWAPLHHASVVAILSKESLLKLSHRQSSVLAIVVASDEELDFFRSWENSNGRKSISKIVDGYAATIALVENLEGIGQVKVTLKGEASLV